MAEKIIIAQLDLDVQSLIKGTADSQATLLRLKTELTEIKRTTGETSAQFLKAEAELKRYTAAFDAQSKAVNVQLNVSQTLVNQQQTINNSLGQTSAAIENQTKTFGDYKQQLLDALSSINIFNGGFGGLISRVREAGGVGPFIKNAFNGITQGIGGMTKAAWGFVANPIGAILTALVKAVEIGMAIFKNFAPVVEKVEQVMAAIGAVIDSVKNSFIALFKGDISFGDFFSGFIGSATEAAKAAMELEEANQKLQKQLELQELTNAKVKNSIDDLMAKSKDLTLSDKERLDALKEAQRIEQENFNQQKKNAEKKYEIAVGQIANGARLTEQEKANLKEKGFAYAQELLERRAISEEEMEMLKTAQLERTKIYGEEKTLLRKHTGDMTEIKKDFQEEEEEDNAKKIQANKDALQARQKLLDDALDKQKQMLDLFIAQNAGEAKSLDERIKYEQKISADSLKILQQELKLKKISQTEYQTAVENLKKNKMKNIADATAEYATAELNLWKEENQSKIKDGEKLTEALIAQEKARLEEYKKRQLKVLELETGTNQEIIDKKRATNQALTTEDLEYLRQKKELNREYIEETTAIDEDFEEQKKTEKAADEQLEYDLKMATAKDRFEQEKIAEEARYAEALAKLEERRIAERWTDEQYDTMLKEEKEKHTEKMDAINEASMNHKLDLASSTFGNLSAILGKESKAGKAMAIAQATIDTYQSAVSAFKSLSGIPMVGPALGAAAAGAAVATGMANVKKIASTKTPKAEKGALFNIGGQRHSAGGTMFTGEDGTRFEAEKGELIGVMNRNAARHFMAFNNAFPAGGSSMAGNYFERGGMVSRDIAPAQLNMQELAALTAEAVKSIPAPVVAVEDILVQGNSYVQVRDGANF